jgi:CheY-like chemotaxis protein
VEDDAAERQCISDLIGDSDILVTAVASGEEALEVLNTDEPFDGMVLDLHLPGMSRFDVMERLQASPSLCTLPVVVYTGQELTKKEEARLHKMSRSIVIKDARSPERLLDETALFLHRVATDLPPEKRKMLERIYESDAALNGKQVLIVDDDVRNIFALTSVLERHGVAVMSAESGKDAIKALEGTPGIGIVLMDIMMPEMDGYETIRAVRKNPLLQTLPVIALTARAMKGDREKCIEAGASDYIAKPVNPDQLLSLLRVWLYK